MHSTNPFLLIVKFSWHWLYVCLVLLLEPTLRSLLRLWLFIFINIIILMIWVMTETRKASLQIFCPGFAQAKF